MKYALSPSLVLAALLTAPTFAADGHVPQSTLKSLGLAEMKVLSDEEGAQVRGMSGNAMAMGLSLVTGLLIDPFTKSYVFGTDADGAMSSAENAGLQVLTFAAETHGSSVALDLNVFSSFGDFSGSLIGGAGGSSMASSQ